MIRHTPATRSLRARDAAAVVGVSVATYWRYVARYPDFPRPRRLSARCTVWDEAELIAWRDSRIVPAAGEVTR